MWEILRVLNFVQESSGTSQMGSLPCKKRVHGVLTEEDEKEFKRRTVLNSKRRNGIHYEDVEDFQRVFCEYIVMRNFKELIF